MNTSTEPKQYSHPCVKEGARIEKARRDNSSIISKETFLSEVDNSAFNKLDKNVGVRANATYHRSGEAIYIDNGDMDYIFSNEKVCLRF